MIFQRLHKNIIKPRFIFKVDFSSLLNHKSIKIVGDIQKNGYTVLNMPDATIQTLSDISYCFGNIQHNNNTSELGISEIIGENHKSDVVTTAAVVSNLKFNAHPDGAYLHDISQIENDVYRKSAPPKLVLLQCIKPAENGGDNYLIDGKVVFDAMLRDDPLTIKTLMDPQSMCISHRYHMITDIPVFGRINDKYLNIRYSYDKSLFFLAWAGESHKIFNEKYLENPKFISHLKLRANQCLVIDNRRMLHGRQAFEGSRHF